MKTGIEIIADERLRQVSEEGYTAEVDTEYTWDELARAAMCYAMPSRMRDSRFHPVEHRWVPKLWPWAPGYWKPATGITPTTKERVKELAKAGALIAAEIDRLQRKESTR